MRLWLGVGRGLLDENICGAKAFVTRISLALRIYYLIDLYTISMLYERG
jgi:hypothetical protein